MTPEGHLFCRAYDINRREEIRSAQIFRRDYLLEGQVVQMSNRKGNYKTGVLVCK